MALLAPASRARRDGAGAFQAHVPPGLCGWRCGIVAEDIISAVFVALSPWFVSPWFVCAQLHEAAIFGKICAASFGSKGRLAQLVRAGPLHGQGRESESLTAHQLNGYARSEPSFGSDEGETPVKQWFYSFGRVKVLFWFIGILTSYCRKRCSTRTPLCKERLTVFFRSAS